MPVAKRDGEAARPVPGVMVFIAGDTASFVLFFTIFMAERLAQPALFARSAAALSPPLGLLNTLILITSGWLVALAVQAFERGETAIARRRIGMAAAVGALFAVVKMIEYISDFRRGLTLTTNDFFSFYFILTGLHFLHFLIGMALLLFVLRMPAQGDARTFGTWLTGVALYWHMVDLLWLFLFPMFYLQALR